VRHYTRDRLLESGEAEQVRERHRDFFLQLVERPWRAAPGEDEAAQMDRLEKEHDNLRAALRWAQASEEGAEAALRMVRALWWFWNVRGYWTEGREWLSGLLARCPGQISPARASALLGAGFLAWQQGEYAPAARLCDESLALYRELGNKAGTAFALRHMGMMAQQEGDFARAEVLLEESLALAQEQNDRFTTALSRVMLGSVASAQGLPARAQALCEEGLTVLRELGDRYGMAFALYVLGLTARSQGAYGAAATHLAESLRLRKELSDRRGIVDVLEGMGSIAAAEAEEQCGASSSPKSGAGAALAGRAGRLCGAAEALREAIHYPRRPVDRAEHERCVAVLRGLLGEAAFAAAWEAGRAMSLDQTITLALAQ
jgi:tetratricopeptide (TPR) repeat protein